MSLPGLEAAAQVARLVGWSEPAQLAPLHGPGESTFRLPAIVRWMSGTPRDERNFQIEVRLPDGSVRVSALTPAERTGAATLSVLVPASSVRNLHPDLIHVSVTLLDATTGAQVSNTLQATIADFPAPSSESHVDSGPAGYGTPLDPDDPARRSLQIPAPDRVGFVALPGGTAASCDFLAIQELSNRQVAIRLPGYDPKSGRSDEFILEGEAQPALGLTPAATQTYLQALTKAAGSGVSFRLPTQEEWNQAARAGSPTPFWWGEEPTYPPGANFIGPEPDRPNDQTANVEGPTSIGSNPWGLTNTFGNIAEWGTSGGSSFVRLGGHFRTESDGRLDPIEVSDPMQLGPDPYVGLRPAFTLNADSVARSIESLLHGEPTLAKVSAGFDASRALATLEGPVPDANARRKADALLRPLWYVAAVENQLAPPTVPAGRLANLIGAAGRAERRRVLDRFEAVVPVRVLWSPELPVAGSEWWVNVQTNGGSWTSYRLPEDLVGRSVIPIVLPAGPAGPVSGLAGLSLGQPDPGLVGPGAATAAIPIQLGQP